MAIDLIYNIIKTIIKKNFNLNSKKKRKTVSIIPYKVYGKIT